MKNSERYARKVKKLLAGPHKDQSPKEVDPVRLLIVSVLAEDVTAWLASSAMADLEAEYVDFNELRASPVKDIVDCLGRDFRGARVKAEMINRALNRIFEHTNALSLDFLAHETKREVRKVLREKLGLGLYAESVLTLQAFEGHAIPVDRLLLESLKAGGHIHADSDLPDLQGFLERIVPAKDDHAAHESLRQFCGKQAARLHTEWTREEKKAAAVRAKAEAAAKAKAEAAAKAKAEAEARAEAKEQAKKEKARKAAAAEKRAASKKKAAKKRTASRKKAATRKKPSKRPKK